MKTRYWFREVLRESGCESAEQLTQACKVAGGLIDLYKIRWERYVDGGQVVQPKTLREVENHFPNTSIFYHVGPHMGLPLWKILEGDIDICKKHINEVLFVNFNIDIRNIIWEQKAVSLLKLFLPTNYWEQLGKPLLANENLVAMAFEDQDNPTAEHVNFSGSSISAVFAMYHIGKLTESDKIQLIVDYLLEGLKQKAIVSEFDDFLGNEVLAYVDKHMPIMKKPYLD
ncbi:hypothetical protein [Burkholderia cepacia]|uniref:hypothetical protein n=1 Tax=Burkholderia cepacia TaxID=292 RepID=UPI00158D4657|nr:hypothetical protein [Burkholderia cepacia]